MAPDTTFSTIRWHLPPPPDLEQIRPSGLARVMACPGSRRLAMQAPPDVSSSYADEGTAAHSLVEHSLRLNRAPFEFYGQSIKVNGRDWKVSGDMVRATGHMVSSLWARFQDGQARYIERRVHVAEIHNGGTADHIIVDVPRNTLHIDDYKHGEGVYVSETWNPQMLAYALGAFQSVWPLRAGADLPGDITVRMTIHQPRYAGVAPSRTHVITSGDLLDWRARKMLPAIEATLQPDAPLKAGAHCIFCPCKKICIEYLSNPDARNFRRKPITPTAIPSGFQF